LTDGGAPRAAPRRPSAALLLFDLAAIAVFGVAVFFTWRRLFVGMDLQDESFYILVPWRWALGDTPFVHEQNLAQVSGLLTYPLVKLFGVVRGYDVTGLVLYTRHLYMLLTVFTAGVVFLVARLVLRWQLALLVAAVFVTYIFWQTPQLSYNTMGALFLTLGTTLGLRSVLGGGSRLWAALAGAACGLAVVAYPTLVFIMPFYGVLLAFSLGRRAVGAVADLRFALPPGQGGEPTGRIAWRAVSFWVLGGVLVLVPAALVVLSFGLGNLRRSWAYSMEVAREGGQLGGATKAVAVVQGFWRFFAERPFVLLGALLVLLVYMRWPRTGRLLLALLPCALWLAGQHALLNASGFVIACAFLTPYLYLFVPRERKELGAKLLIWVWAPSMIAGAMTAFTSAAGYVNAAVGLLPTLLASGGDREAGGRGRDCLRAARAVPEGWRRSLCTAGPLDGPGARRSGGGGRRDGCVPVPVPAARCAVFGPHQEIRLRAVVWDRRHAGALRPAEAVLRRPAA
jgi:hypothetical protein